MLFKLRLKYNPDYWLDTAKSKSNANMRKVNMMVQRLVVVLLMMLFLVGCGEDEPEISSVFITKSVYNKIVTLIYNRLPNLFEEA